MFYLRRNAAGQDGSEMVVSKFERFPASHNNGPSVQVFVHCCEQSQNEYQQWHGPLRCSEQFAYLSRICPKAPFGFELCEVAVGLHPPTEYGVSEDMIPTSLGFFRSYA